MNQLSLFELNQLVRATLDTNLEPSYWVIAEISDLKVSQKGHCYMELVQKDQDSILAKVRANIWSYNYRKLGSWFEGITGMPLKPGIKVLFNVEVQFHEVFGYSLTIRDIDPNFTLGEKARKRQEILKRLKEEELLELNKQKDLPLVPQRIAIISSSTAAGYEDFLKQLKNNIYGYGFKLEFFQSVMQGHEAENSIIRNLERIADNHLSFDVVVIIRGGGSQIDMDCFDSYLLAKQVANMPIPVITGIGHDRDQSIVDKVAHTDVHTPTAAGDFIISGIAHFESKLGELNKRLRYIFEKRFYNENQKLRDYINQLNLKVSGSLQHQINLLDQYSTRLKTGVTHLLEVQMQNLNQLSTKVRLLDPNEVLKRGFTITTLNGHKLDQNNQAVVGDTLKTYTDKIVMESVIEKMNTRK